MCRLAVDSLIFPPVTYAGFYFLKDFVLRKERENVNYK